MNVSSIAVKVVITVAFLFIVILVIDIHSYKSKLIPTLITPLLNKSTSLEMHHVSQWKGTNRSLTVVTAYFDIGKFPKGTMSNMRGPDTYRSWMKIYKYLKNPLVVYTDSQNFANFFSDLRKNTTATTKIVVIDRKTLWSFKIKSNIAKLYAKPGYPKHYPNTYIPEYTSMTHSKLSVVSNAITSKLFPSDYYCWIDLGYFRDLAGRHRDFYLEVPNDFDNSRVGVTRVINADLKKVTARSIILGNRNWIGGGLFLGKPSILLKFESQYKKRVMYYLSQELMNVEQHILYSMFTKEERKKNPISVEVQTYIPGTKHVACSDPWFYLGCLMYNEVTKEIETKTTTNNRV